MGPSKFNSKMAIITAMESITDDELKQYILENLSTFNKGSKFTIFGGHHHSGPAIEKPKLENVHLAETDPKLSYNHHMVQIYHPFTWSHIEMLHIGYISLGYILVTDLFTFRAYL